MFPLGISCEVAGSHIWELCDPDLGPTSLNRQLLYYIR